MAELGCKGSANFETLQVDKIDVGIISSNHLSHITGSYDNLTLTAITDGDADAGFTAIANSYHELEWDGDQAGAIQLPNNVVDGTLVVLHFKAAANGGANLVITTGTRLTPQPHFTITSYETFFATQTLIFFTQNFGDATRLPRVIGQLVRGTGGQKQAHFNADNLENTLTISATAAHNQTNIGAELAFYYKESGTMQGWNITFQGSEEGNGTMNVTFASSRVG